MGMTAICRATPHADARPSYLMKHARGASMNCKCPRVGARSVRRGGLQRAPAAALEDATLPTDERPLPQAPTPNTARFENMTPGKADAERFQLHPSVLYWQDRPAISKTDTISAAQDVVEMLSKRLRDAVASGDPTRMAYWSYHVTRTTFFAVQESEESEMKAQSVIDGGNPEMLIKTVRSLTREALDTYEQDLQMIEAGYYKLPWDMTTLGHRQYNPLFVMQRALGFVEEARGVVKRRRKQAEPRIWLDSDMYPKYYLSTFHYQTDGWMSRRSARVYEDSTESLFLGRQDAMQRQTLVPIQKWMQGKSPNAVRMLEVAAGTGRFATFVKDNYPAAHLTVSDLSPFYLEEARSNVQYWKRMRAPQLDLGGEDGTGVEFVQAAAEKLPFSDASFDLLYCVYLFHELPLEVRSAAVAEFSRVLKPGGLLVLTDSQQHDDHKNLPYDIEAFGKFNEPHYVDYVSTDLGALFEEHGLACGEKVMMSATKVLSAVKI